MTVIYREDFETDGNGTRYTTSVPEFTDFAGDFFIRTDGTDIGSFYQVTGQAGSGYFAVMDTDGEAPFATTLTMEINDIDITGYSNLQISGLFAEDDDGSAQDWDADSLVYIEVSIDDAGYVKVLQFAATGGTNTEPGLDTDFDGTADSTLLTDTFQTFMADIAGTGSSLDIRITVENLNAGDEDISFDDITVSGTSAATEVTVLDETFDDATGFSTSTPFFSDGGWDYFGITDGAGGGDFGGQPAPSGAKAITGNEGNYLVGMDLDGEGASLPITVTWDSIDISGLTDLSFSGDFAEFFDNPGDIDDADFIIIEASIDGGAPQTVLEFRGADFSSTGGPFNGVFREDTDGDGVGDGAALTDALSTFTADIAGTGSTLTLTMTVSVNSGDEDFAVDNFQIKGTGGGTAQPAVIARTTDGLAVKEEGATTDTFTLELATTPQSPVTVTVAAPDAQTEISTDGVNFSTSVDVVLSDTTQATVTIRAIDDSVDEATPHTGSIGFTVASADAAYDGLPVNDLTASIGDNDFTITLIHDIQGSGDASALVGKDVTIEGVVVGTLTDGSGNISGYFVQEEDADADADAATSEGIFVFSPGAAVSVGDQVRVSGEVAEFNGLTELTNVTEFSTLQTGVTLPTATLITLGMAANFEAYEGMRVELVSGSTDPLTVITNFNLDRFGEVEVSEGVQVQPTQIFDPDTQQAEIQDLLAKNDANRLTIDDGSTDQNPDTLRLIDDGTGDPLDAGDPITADGPTLRLGAEVDSITGVMDQRFGDYRLQADGPLDTVPGTNADARPDTAPDVGGELKVASFNVLNYFTTLDDGSGGTGPDGTLDPRGAETAEDLQRQTDKIVAALIELDADIIGIQEIENNGFDEGSAIDTLVDALNAELGAEVYAYVDPGTEFAGTDAITTGIIYKVDAVTLVGADVLVYEESSAAETLAVADQIQSLLGGTFVGDLQRNRPTLVATFEDDDGSEITIAVNHYKSKGDSGLENLLDAAVSAGIDQGLIDALLADPNYDQGDGQGFWNQVRADAAAELDAWLATNPTGATQTDSILILGDLNAYAQEDPLDVLDAAGFTDLAAEFIGEGAYSFVFDGQRGTLDYGLADGTLMDNITGVAEWHINADEPDLLNYSSDFNNPAFYNDDFYASSDHDPLVIGLTLDDPTLTARLEFTTGTPRALMVDYLLEDVHQDTLYQRKVSHEAGLDEIGVHIDAVGGPANLPVQAAVPVFLNSIGAGLGVFTPGDNRGVSSNDAQLVEGDEKLVFSLTDTAELADAGAVTFEFAEAIGSGDVVLDFYDDGQLVESVQLQIVNGEVSHDLAGNTGFDQVSLGVSDTLAVSLSAVEFERFAVDELEFV